MSQTAEQRKALWEAQRDLVGEPIYIEPFAAWGFLAVRLEELAASA